MHRAKQGMLKCRDWLQHEKWRGEGVSQPSFKDACVSRVSAISISCTSSKMAESVRILLASLHGLQGGQKEAQGIVCAGGVELKVELMGAEWARSVRTWRGQPERARFESLECVAGGAAATSLEALRYNTPVLLRALSHMLAAQLKHVSCRIEL